MISDLSDWDMEIVDPTCGACPLAPTLKTLVFKSVLATAYLIGNTRLPKLQLRFAPTHVGTTLDSEYSLEEFEIDGPYASSTEYRAEPARQTRPCISE
jgi:hypothetical protein